MCRKNGNRTAKVKKRSRRRPKTLPPERARALALTRMKAAAAAAEREKSLYTRGGMTFARLPNGGFSDSCGPICLMQHAMKSDGVPIAVIEEATNGKPTPEVMAFVRYIREITVDTSDGHIHSTGLHPNIEDEVHTFEDLVDGADREILTKPMWDKIMRYSRGYFDGRAVMIGVDALGLDGLVIVRMDSDGFLMAVDGATTPIADAKHLIFWDGYAHFEVIFPEEELYPIFPDVDDEFFFDGHAHPGGIVVEELPSVSPDMVDEWEKYRSATRTNTLGVDDGGVATNGYASDVADVVDVERRTASSSPAALLFAYVMLRSVMFFCRFSLLQSVVEAMGFAVVISRYIGCVVWECTARAEATWDDRYTGFTPDVPDGAHRCRLVRDRRYRAGTTGGLSRQAFRRTVASVHQFLAEIHPPPEPLACRWTNKSVVCGAVYIASVAASALAYGWVVASTVFVAMSTWAAASSFLFPAGHGETQAQAVNVDTRIGADPYRMGGRRRLPCRVKTHRRYGRRRGSGGYLKKQLMKEKDKSVEKQGRAQQRKSEAGLAFVRAGASPTEVVPRSRSGRPQKRRNLDSPVQASSAPTDHLGWLYKEAVLRQKVETQDEYSEEDLEKWLVVTKDKRDAAREIFEREERQRKEREREEAAQRDRQAGPEDEDGRERECELCRETEHRPDGDDIILCDFEGCTGASHLGCCEPPLLAVPEGDWYCHDCRTTGRAAGSNQGGVGFLPGADVGVDEWVGGTGDGDDEALPDAEGGGGGTEGGDDEALPDAEGGGGGTEGGDDEALPDAEGGGGGTDGGDDEALPDAEGGGGGTEGEAEGGGGGRDQPPSPLPPVEPRKRGSRAPKESRLRLPLHFNKWTSLMWRSGEGVAMGLFNKLCDNYAKAKAKLEEIAEGRPDPDTRTLTLKQIEEALSDTGGKAFRDVVVKLEKHDYKLYGVKVQGGGEEGTRVKHAETSATGTVTRFFVDPGDGYNGFDIQWDNCHDPSRFSTREVLEGATLYSGDQGVASPEDDDKRGLLFLRAVLCMVNIQVQNFVVKDNTKFKRKYYPVALAPGEVAENTTRIRQTAWRTIQEAKLGDTMTDREKEILGEADGNLLEEVGRTGSLLEALGLVRNKDSDDCGFITTNVERAKTFHGRHMTFVNHFVRGAQTSWKLGRPTSVESCIAPLCAGAAVEVSPRGEVNELSDPQFFSKLKEHEKTETISSFKLQMVGGCGLGVRLLLARARVSTRSSQGASYGTFKWWTYCPLYRQFDFTRPERMGVVSATTENTGRASQVRRNRDFYASAVKLRESKENDSSILEEIFDAYEPVATQKRNEAAAHENSLARIGRGSKVNAGRTMEEWEGECKFLGGLVKECGIDPIMEKIGDAGRQKEVIEMCLEVLKDGDGVTSGTRVDESHLYPEAHRESINEVVDVLDKAGVSAEDLERFSGALHILDSLTSACLRPQDSLGCLACRAYIKNGRLVFRLPEVAKNSVTLLKSATGMVVNHVKDEIATGPFMVMLVIGRRLMRLRLQENYQKACDELERAREQHGVEEGRGGKGAAKALREFKKARGEVKQYAPKKIDRSAQADRALNSRVSEPRVLGDAELGNKAAPFTRYGKNYSNDQLLSMYKHVGKYALGLPAFGPNILRTIHVTTVMTLCYRLNISVDDQCIKDHFALARHGEYEMQRSYDLVKSDSQPYDPSSFTARVSGVLKAQDLLRDGNSPDFKASKRAALKECFGTSLFGGPERLEGESSLERQMREIRAYVEEIAARVSTQNIVWNQETIELENVKRQEELRLEIAKSRAERQTYELKSGPSVSAGVGAVATWKRVPGVDESQEIGRKRGLDAGAGVSCKSVKNGDEDNKPKPSKAKRGTFVQEGEGHTPLLSRMNGHFKRVVVQHISPDAKYSRYSQEGAIRKVKTFGGLCKEQVKRFMMANVSETDDGYCDVVDFYRLFTPESKEANVRDITKRKGMVWSDWLCRKCKKVECECPG